MTTARVTVTLPPEIVQEMDRLEGNRSRFVLEAVRRELDRRRQEALRMSLDRPHPEAHEFAEQGLADWGGALSGPVADDLLVRESGRSVRWVSGQGWVEAEQ